MTYIDQQVDQFDLRAALAAVSDQRRCHALRYRQEHDQRLSVAAFRLLQHALREEHGIVAPPTFIYDVHGKPMLSDHPDIFFNLSHCHEAAACVVGTAPVGIDVESLSNYNADIVTAVMSDDEQRQIASSSDPRFTFIRLWTMKESLLKMTGEGMTDNLRHALNHPAIHSGAILFHTTVYPQFVCTVCYSKDDSTASISKDD